MKSFSLVVLFIANLILNITLFSRIEVLGVILNLTIPIIIVLSMSERKGRSAYYGLFMGLMEDILFGNILGVKALSYYLIGYYVYKSQKNKGFDYKIGFIMTILATFFNGLFTGLVGVIADKLISFNNLLAYLKYPILIEIAINLLVFTIVYLIFKSIDTKRKRKYYM